MPFTEKQERYLHANNIEHSHDEPIRPPVDKKKDDESICIKCGKVREFWINESSNKKMCTECGNIEKIGENDDYWADKKGVKNRYNPDGYTPKYGVGDRVTYDDGGETPAEGDITHTQYAPDQAHHKIDGKYRPENSIHGKVSSESKGTTYQGFIQNSINYYKKKFATEQVGMFYSIPQSGGVKKIKGLLAYAGVSLNNRLYLPEELAKGHEMTVPLLLNHSSTAGAEAEVPYLPQKYQDNLQRGIDTKVGEVTLHWDPSKLTLSYEGYVEDEYFINEVNEGKMGVSLGMVYDANSPKICNEQCYTMIKGAEFREVSLVYHPGFPIVTIESNEALLKQKALEAIST